MPMRITPDPAVTSSRRPRGMVVGGGDGKNGQSDGLGSAGQWLTDRRTMEVALA